MVRFTVSNSPPTKRRVIVWEPTARYNYIGLYHLLDNFCGASESKCHICATVTPDFGDQWFIHWATKFVMKMDWKWLYKILVRNNNSLILRGRKAGVLETQQSSKGRWEKGIGTLASKDDFVITFELFVLSVVNFNLCFNFWTLSDRNCIFDLHTPLIMSFQMRSMTLWL